MVLSKSIGYLLLCTLIRSVITNSNGSLFDLEINIVPVNHFSTLQFKTFKVVFPPDNYLPYLTISRGPNNETIYHGLMVDMLEKMANDAYGVLINGTWNGLVGMAYRKEVDIIAAPLTITHARSHVIDFSLPYAAESIGILIRVQKTKKSLWNMIFVFTPMVWISILSSCIGSMLLMRIFYHLDIVMPHISSRRTFRYCLWLAYGNLLNQICEIKAKTWSHRIFQLSWRMCVFLLISTYVGGLVAALATARLSLPFENLKGLAEAIEREEYKICVPRGTAFYDAVMTDDVAEYKILKKWLDKNYEFVATDQACSDLLKMFDNIAFVHELTYLEGIQMKYCLEFETVLLDDYFFPGYLAIGLQKHSWINDIISQTVTEVVDSGLMECWKAKYALPPKFCHISQASKTVIVDSKSLAFVDVGGAFILFAIGLCIGSLIVIFEFLQNRQIPQAPVMQQGVIYLR